MRKLKRYSFDLLNRDIIKNDAFKEEILNLFIESLPDGEVISPEEHEKESAAKAPPFQSIRVNQQQSGGFQPPQFVYTPPNLYDVDGASLEHLATFWGGIKDVALKTNAPGRMIVISALGAIATIVQGLYDVKSPLGMVHPLSQNTIVIALSGERKTTVDKYFAKVFTKILKLINKKIQELNENFESDLELWEMDNKVLKKAYMDSKKKGKVTKKSTDESVKEKSGAEPENVDSIGERSDLLARKGDSNTEAKPAVFKSEEEIAYRQHKKLKPRQLDSLNLIHDDFTIGAVLQNLYTNLPVASIMTSEGAKVLDDASMKVIPFLNKLWDAVSIQVSRIVRGSFWLSDVRLSSSIMIQPDVIKKIMEKRHDELRSSGYFSRALFCNPVSIIGMRPVYATQQKTENLDRFHARLAEMTIELLCSLTDPNFKRKELELNQEAEQLWLQFANNVESNMFPGNYLSLVTDHGSKLSEIALRTAGTLHAFQFGDGKISGTTMYAAIQICLQSSKDFVELFNPVPQEERFGLKLKKYLFENYIRKIQNVPENQLYFEERFLSQNQVLQCGPLTKSEELNLGLKWLQAQGYLRVVKELPGEGQKKPKYYIDILPVYFLPPLSPRGRQLHYVIIN